MCQASSHRRRAVSRSEWVNGMNSRRGGNKASPRSVVRSVHHDEGHLGLSLKMHTAIASVTETVP